LVIFCFFKLEIMVVYFATHRGTLVENLNVASKRI